jgi:hypothetical protein
MRATLFVGAAAAAALLAGCGGSGGGAGAAASTSPATAGAAPSSPASPAASSPAAAPSPTTDTLADASAGEILAAAQKAFAAAPSVRLAGTVTDSGQKIGLDLRIKKGAGATGTLTVGGKPVRILRIGKAAYVQGSPAFYGALMDASTARLLAGKWLKMSTSSKDFAGLLPLTDLQTFAKGVFTPTGAVGKGAVTTYAGKRVVELRDSDGSTLDVALDGPAYPLRVTGPRSAGAGQTLTFTAYGAAVPLSPPPAAQVVALPGA